MTIGSISFQSNISIILITIIMILICVYFFLDSRKMKLQIDKLQKSEEDNIKDITKLQSKLIFAENYNLSNSNKN